jgi:hypothetical protein
VVAALEPEPGMLVETLDDWKDLSRDRSALTLALDLGHCLVTGEREPPAAVREFAANIGTVAIEDMRRGDHTHLPFGEGDMDIPACLDALEAVGFPASSASSCPARATARTRWFRDPSVISANAADEDPVLQPALLPRDQRHERLRAEPAAPLGGCRP